MCALHVHHYVWVTLVCQSKLFLLLCYCLVYTCRKTRLDVTSFLTSISPLLDGQIEFLKLMLVSIDSAVCVGILVQLLTSPHSSLHELILFGLTISSSDYHHLTTAIATSNLTHFNTIYCLHNDVSAAKGLATALTHSKTLEEVEVIENHMISEIATILAEAMNHSSVKKLVIGCVSKGTLLDCSYPTDRVKIEYGTW